MSKIRSALILFGLCILFVVIVGGACNNCVDHMTGYKTVVVDPTPTPAPVEQPTPATVQPLLVVDYSYCLITDYTKALARLNGEIETGQPNLGYRLDNKSSYNSLPMYRTEFKIFTGPGVKDDPFPRAIIFGKKVDGNWKEIGRVDLPPWMSVDNCGYRVSFNFIGPDGEIISGRVVLEMYEDTPIR